MTTADAPVGVSNTLTQSTATFHADGPSGGAQSNDAKPPTRAGTETTANEKLPISPNTVPLPSTRSGPTSSGGTARAAVGAARAATADTATAATTRTIGRGFNDI